MIAMINKNVLVYKIWLPFYGEKVFFTMGLKYNYELLLFWGPGAPFKNNYHLHEEYKLAAKKIALAEKLRFRITVLALINLVFSPFIFLYQILYSFFSYAELLKRQPGVFGRRRWSLFGRQFLRHFNELDHELTMRLNRAYRPSVKYTDLFVNPIATVLARNVAFVSGSLLAVLFTLTVVQEDLLTAHNILTSITLLGIIVTVCRIFIPNEHQTRDPKELMTEILEEIHYMPDLWKDRPHTLEVSSQFGQVFQLTIAYVVDELLSPIITPFILYFSLRNKSFDIIEFLRNFTIDVSGVGDVCSFAEMNLRKHGHPEWQETAQLTHSTEYERAELGKTELSLVNFSVSHTIIKH
jgi:autophagy-related protein 9